MNFTDIVVHLTGSSRDAACLQIGIALAARHKALLTGLYVAAPPYVPTYFAEGTAPERILMMFRDEAAAKADKAEALFHQKTADMKTDVAWERTEATDIVDTLALNVRFSDMAIVSQGVRAEFSYEELTDMLLMLAGRPILIVPRVGDFQTVGERIVVGWDASRLATRAIADALPFLTHAKDVAVVSVDPQRSNKQYGTEIGTRICRHLVRHGVKAHAETVTDHDADAGSVLLSQVKEMDADLLVMGAYGHRRIRELVLGGATRQILENMTVPVFMSH